MSTAFVSTLASTAFEVRADRQVRRKRDRRPDHAVRVGGVAADRRPPELEPHDGVGLRHAGSREPRDQLRARLSPRRALRALDRQRAGIDAVAVRRREEAAFDLRLAEGASGDLDVVDEAGVLRRIRRILTRADAEVVHRRQRVADLAARRARVRQLAVLVEPNLGSVVGQREVGIEACDPRRRWCRPSPSPDSYSRSSSGCGRRHGVPAGTRPPARR